MSETQEKIVYFVRHGQSVGNTQPIFTSNDSPLSRQGEKQAKLIAERVKSLEFDQLIVSPYVRTKQTAEVITSITGKQPEFSELFVECKKPSKVVGKPFTDPASNKLWQSWQESLFGRIKQKVEDGETYREIIDRTDKALDFLKNYPANKLVVVTHGFFLRSLILRIISDKLLTPELFSQMQTLSIMQNTALTVVKYESIFDQPPGWKLWIYNDHAHLAE